MANEVIKDDIEEEGIEQDQYLVFTVESREFGIQAMRVKEISSMLGTTEVPNAPPYIEGIMNLRGQLASVINFRHKLGFEQKKHDEDTRIIIVEQAGFPIGILVDSVEEVIKISDKNVHEMPESTTTSVSKDYITGVGMLEDRLIILLNVNQVLTKKELVEAHAIQQMMDKAEKTDDEIKNKELVEAKKKDTKTKKAKRRKK